MQCKLCSFTGNEADLIQHYELHHRRPHHWPCVHTTCVCVFRTRGALKSHLSRVHNPGQTIHQSNIIFKCELCDFHELCSEGDITKHLGNHLKVQERIQCPFLNCQFKTNSYSGFSSHRSRKHKGHTISGLRSVLHSSASDLVGVPEVTGEASTSLQSDSGSFSGEAQTKSLELIPYESIEHKIAKHFLSLQTVLHVSRSAVQEIIEETNDILTASKSHCFQSVAEVLQKHNIAADNSLIQDIVESVFLSNPLLVTTSGKGCLSTDYRRNLYFKQNFPFIEPVEYLYQQNRKNTFVYVPLKAVLQNLLRRSDFANVLSFRQEHLAGVFRSFQDSYYFKQSNACTDTEKDITLALYIDEFEVCNPLGTSRKIHKIVGVYWIVLNLPAKFRASLTSIQLAALGRSIDVKKFGYERYLEPLLKDLKFIEEYGTDVSENFRVKLFCVCADNLGAHSLAGFQESFRVDKFCRFCLVSHSQIATVKATDFQLRTVEQHNRCVDELHQNPALKSVSGVKGECVLSKHLSFFHPVTGFPPDILHDLFEGVIPIELSLCLQDLISKGFFTLDRLNHIIRSFPYKNSDQVNKPKIILKAAFSKHSIGGNGHENWALLRLLPLMIGDTVPVNEPSWEILMDLKEIVEIVVSDKVTEEALCYLTCKLSDHRSLVKATFPTFVLKPKHHIIEHYPHLIRCFGPLVDLWTMRFESKHGLFKKVARNVHNTKNLLLSLATKHQQLMAYHLDGQSLFKADINIEKVKAVRVSSLDSPRRNAILAKFPNVDIVNMSCKIQLFGTEYAQNMIIMSGERFGQPELYKILSILVCSDKVSFLSKRLTVWYFEHYRSFEVEDSDYAELFVLDADELTHFFPLTAYYVGGKLWVTLRARLY